MTDRNAAPLLKAKLGKIMVSCIFFVLLATPTLLHAQTRGTVEVVKDSRIDTLIARRMDAPKTTATGTASVYLSPSSGYRVQIFSGSSRASAYTAMAKMQQLHPELRTYISYREPDFKVHAGDFRSRLEATKFVQDIRYAFPVLFIIPEKINPPKLDTP